MLWIFLGFFSFPLFFFSHLLFTHAFLSSSNNSYLVSLSVTTSRKSSILSTSTPRLKLPAISATALLIFAPPHLQQILRCHHGQTSWVSSSICHLYNSHWHHPKPKWGFWCSYSAVLTELQYCLPQLQQNFGQRYSSVGLKSCVNSLITNKRRMTGSIINDKLNLESFVIL